MQPVGLQEGFLPLNRSKMSQSLSKLFVHIVFSTKDRQPLIQPDVMSDLYSYISGIVIGQNAHIHEIDGVEDHVHLLVTLPRTLALCDLLEETKKCSSKWIKTKGEAYKGFSWQKGYGAFSCDPSNCKSLRSYIRNQKEGHKKMTYQDEMRFLLKKYEIEYDERYVWE
jgi:putative transposase